MLIRGNPLALPFHRPVIGSMEMNLPNLVRVQQESWKRFLHGDPEGWSLRQAFERHMPVFDPTGRYTLMFKGLQYDLPKHPEEHYIRSGQTYAMRIRATLHMVEWAHSADQERYVRNVIEKEVDLGSIPALTSSSLFIINGGYRVMMNQIRRSAGPYFSKSAKLPEMRMITDRGVWADLKVGRKGSLLVSFDKRSKSVNLITFLRALNLDPDYCIDSLAVDTFKAEVVKGRLQFKYRGAGAGAGTLLKSELPKEHRKLFPDGVCSVGIGDSLLSRLVAVKPIVDTRTNDVLVPAGELLKDLDPIRVNGATLKLCPASTNAILVVTARNSRVLTQDEAVIHTYGRMKSQASNPSVNSATQAIHFTIRGQSLGYSGRARIRDRFGDDYPVSADVLHVKPE